MMRFMRGCVGVGIGLGAMLGLMSVACAEDAAPDKAKIDAGETVYNTYCAVCHGEQGKGDGPISGKIPPPPSYVSDRLMQFPPGRIFHVISMGTGKMPAYAAQLTADERWKVVTYVHTVLQGLSSGDRATQSGGAQ